MQIIVAVSLAGFLVIDELVYSVRTN